MNKILQKLGYKTVKGRWAREEILFDVVLVATVAMIIWVVS